MSHRYDIFCDLARAGAESTVAAVLATLAEPDGPGPEARITCIATDDMAIDASRLPSLRVVPIESAFDAANDCIARAAAAGRSLVVALEPTLPSSDVIAMLSLALRRDPFFGFAIPRHHAEDGIGLKSLYGDRGGAPETLPRRVLAEIDALYVMPDVFSPCFLVSSTVLEAVGALEASFDSLAGAWLHFMCRARRMGFRCAVVNRAVLPLAERSGGSVHPSAEDIRRIRQQYPDSERADTERTRHPAHLRERMMARAVRKVDRTLLIDARAAGASFNGTAAAVLDIADGIHALRPEWRITLAALPTAIQFHGIRERFPDWEVLPGLPRRKFTAAFRPSQPWAMETLLELHRHAFFNFYTVLDTIAWDVLYAAPRGLDGAWKFLSRYADGLLYNSQFTRDRFVTRFEDAAHTPGVVCHHSFHPRDYPTPASAEPGQAEPHLFVVGNELDHKDVKRTVELLSSAFPYEPIRALGMQGAEGHARVVGYPSGALPQAALDALYADARFIVFPSLYEGFGLPVIKGLSAGKTVFARRSTLLEELAANYRGPGKLVAYDGGPALIEAIARCARGYPVAELALGTGLAADETPLRWTDVAARVLDFIGEQTQHVSGARWDAREWLVGVFGASAPLV